MTDPAYRKVPGARAGSERHRPAIRLRLARFAAFTSCHVASVRQIELPPLPRSARRNRSEGLQLNQQYESARLHHRGAFAHHLVYLAAAVLLIDRVPARAEGEEEPLISPCPSLNHDTLAWNVLTHFY